MRPSSSDLHPGPLSRGRPPRVDRRRGRHAQILVAAAALVLLLGGPTWAGSATATAATEQSSSLPSTETTSGAPESDRTPTGAPSEDKPADAAPEFTVDDLPSPVRLPQTIGGTRTAGAEVQVQGDDGSGQPLCIAPADASTRWSCVIEALPSGPAVPLRLVALSNGRTSEQRLSVAWLNAPTLVASDKPTTAGQVGGRGYPGATVTVTVSSTGNSCSVVVDTSGSWTCVLDEPLPSGTYTATAVQRTDFSGGPSAASPAATVLIDKDPPPLPRLLAPVDGSTVPLSGSTVSGEGEDGNSVIVFAGARPLCQATVKNGVWSCRAEAVPAGVYRVNAMQMDSAGNASSATPAVSVTFTDTAPATPTPTPGGSASTAGGGPATPGAGAGGPSDGGAAGSAPSTGGTDPGAAPSAPGPTSGSGGFATRWLDSLRTPTTLGTSLAPLASVQAPQLALAAGLAAATVALILVPALLAGRALRGRLARLPSVTGRNRERGPSPSIQGPSVDRWTRAVFGTAIAAGLLTLSMPVLAQSNYLRLAVAAAVAIALLNLVGTVAVVRSARRFFGVEVVTVTRLPLLALTAMTALASRIFGLTPPLVTGQILGIRFADTVSPRRRSAVSLAQVTVTVALTVGGWIAYSALPAQGGTLQLLLSETSGVLTLAGASSAALAVIPLGILPGAVLLKRSRLLWAATTTLAWSLLFLVLTAVTPGHTAPALTSILAVAVGFSVVSSTVWIWTRYVEPVLRTD